MEFTDLFPNKYKIKESAKLVEPKNWMHFLLFMVDLNNGLVMPKVPIFKYPNKTDAPF